MAIEKSGLTEGHISTLFGGVSRQPHAVRRENQVQESDNCLTSVVTGGFEKRPSTQLLAKLTKADTSKTYTVFNIDRDPGEQRQILLDGGSILAYNAITGAQLNLGIADSAHYFLINQASINSTGVITFSNGDAFQGMSTEFAETAFAWDFVMSDAVTGVFKVEGSADNSVWNDLATGKTGASGTFSTTIDAVVTGDHNYIRINMTTGAATGADTITLFATFKDMTYLVDVVDGGDFSMVAVADHTFITNRLKATRMREPDTGTVDATTYQDFAALEELVTPSGAGTIYRITGNEVDKFGTFYVQDNATTSTFQEIVDPTIANKFDATVMPHQIVRNSDGTLTFGQVSWKARAAGDNIVNPEPTFVGKNIKDIVFYRNRLGLIADENVYLGESGDALDMWAKKAVDVLATDPIDRAASTSRVTLLEWATVYRKLLFTTAIQAQFELSGGANGITTENASLDLSTSYVAAATAKPKAMGDTLYFGSDGRTGTILYEYFFDDGSFGNTASDVTKHAKDYIPTDVIQIETDAVTGSVFLLVTGEQNVLYVYRTFFDGTKKVQSAWGKYVFGPTEADCLIHGFGIFSGFLVLILERAVNGGGNAIYMEQATIEREGIDSDIGFIPLLDQREIVTGVYNSANDVTTWTTTYEHDSDAEVILGGSGHADGNKGRSISNLYPDRFELTLATVTAAQTLVINGTTFTAVSTATSPSNREFNISGTNTADATELAIVINDSSKGVTGVTASSSGAVVTLVVDDLANDVPIVTPTGTTVTNSTITVRKAPTQVSGRGDHSAGTAYVGRPYSATTELSRIFPRREDGSSDLNSRLQLREITFAHDNTGYYKVRVTPQARDSVDHEFTARTLGSGNMSIGKASIEVDGVFRVPVNSDARTVKIEIINDQPFPSVITGASWVGFLGDSTNVGGAGSGTGEQDTCGSATASFNITQGTASIGANQITSILINNTEIMGEPVDHTGQNPSTATLVAAVINASGTGGQPETSTFANKTLSVSAQIPNPDAMTFRPDGTRMFLGGTVVSDALIFPYDLTTVWDITTATVGTALNLDTALGFTVRCEGLAISADGTVLWFIDRLNDNVYQLVMSSPWVITSAVYSGVFLDISAQDTQMEAIFVDSTGHRMFLAGTINDKIYRYEMVIANNLGTASYQNDSKDVSGEDLFPEGLSFVNMGKTMLVLGGFGLDVNRYTLSTAWDLSTASADSVVFDLSGQIVATGAVFFDLDAKVMIATEPTIGDVEGYTITLSPVVDGTYKAKVGAAGSEVTIGLSADDTDGPNGDEVIITTTGDVKVNPSVIELSGGGCARSRIWTGNTVIARSDGAASTTGVGVGVPGAGGVSGEGAGGT